VTITSSIKTGADHLAALRDGRAIIIDGEVVSNHVDHPAFRRAVRSAAALYDYNAQADHRAMMTFPSPSSGGAVSRAWQLPTSYDELVARRDALEQVAATTCGWVGRTPDHVASTLSAMVMGIELFERHGRARAAALRDYFTWARDHDVWCAYAIVPPQTDRTPGPDGKAADFVNAGVCDEDHEGITVKGARLLATGVPMAQELLVAAVQPLKAGDEKYSFTATVPLAAKGLKLLSRRSYEAAASSEFDYPLSSRFDENDCIVYFDEVKIPWERVFVHNDVAMARAQWFDIPVMSYQNYPAQIRLAVKMRFLLGLARRMAEANGILQFPSTQETLGQMAAEVNLIDGMISAMEARGTRYGPYFVPNTSLQYSSMVLSQQLYPAFVNRIRELAGGAMIAQPSCFADLVAPQAAGYVERTQGSGAKSAVDRVKLFKLAWDAIGSEFGSRHTQYEMFYAGPGVGSRMRNFGAYDWGRATALVDGLMAGIPSPDAISRAARRPAAPRASTS
jgi:4-hydroxyphenylacetate 3-monooxygenase